MTQYKCKTINCDKIAVFGYNDKKNISCEKHKNPKMIFTFQQSDFSNIDVLDIQKTNRICIMKSCETSASFNFLGNSKRLFCYKHKLETMVRVIPITCKCKNASNTGQCSDCVKIYKKSRANTKLGFLSTLLNNSRHRALKNKEKGKEQAAIHTINLQTLIKKWDSQKGLCYYSNIPMNHFNNTEWSASLFISINSIIINIFFLLLQVDPAIA